MYKLNLSLLELTDITQVLNEEIRKRASRRSSNPICKHFIVLSDSNQVAYLSVDRRIDINVLVLYEIFVPYDFRGNGIGSKLLLEVDSLAAAWGFPRITVSPRPFENNFPPLKLIAWYKKHGYVESSQFYQELEKTIL